MKNKYYIIIIILFVVRVSAQGRLQYYRPDNQLGINVFETSKKNTDTIKKLNIKIGGDFAMQFQGLNHLNAADNLVELSSNMNLPTANLNLEVQIENGLRMHLRVYLSSRHHVESYVKGGYLQIDNLDFIKDDFLNELMKITTIKIGMDEINYGDAHFRRSDNARTIYNPFVGNYIMDSFSTEAFGEITVQNNGLIGVVGITNGKLNQGVVVSPTTDNKLSFYGKLGYDDQLNDDLRLRLTGSWYLNKGESTGTWLYGGDRAGSRYYNVMDLLNENTNDFSGRYNARFTEVTAIQINPFVKYREIEFFGVYEIANGSADGEGAVTQIGVEALCRFGKKDNLYIGTRYNTVKGNIIENSDDIKINRFNIGGGWFMTKNILTKIEYVSQTYNGDGLIGNNNNNERGKFNGVMLEATISF